MKKLVLFMGMVMASSFAVSLPATPTSAAPLTTVASDLARSHALVKGQDLIEVNHRRSWNRGWRHRKQWRNRYDRRKYWRPYRSKRYYHRRGCSITRHGIYCRF